MNSHRMSERCSCGINPRLAGVDRVYIRRDTSVHGNTIEQEADPVDL